MLFSQCYPTFQRFDCKVFLTDALRYFSGASERVMIDNTHVVVLRGTGREMVAVPEMAAFAERFGFRFVAHELGHANRSARVRFFDVVFRQFRHGRGRDAGYPTPPAQIRYEPISRMRFLPWMPGVKAHGPASSSPNPQRRDHELEAARVLLRRQHLHAGAFQPGLVGAVHEATIKASST